jgi:hypothetical protein
LRHQPLKEAADVVKEVINSAAALARFNSAA